MAEKIGALPAQGATATEDSWMLWMDPLLHKGRQSQGKHRASLLRKARVYPSQHSEGRWKEADDVELPHALVSLLLPASTFQHERADWHQTGKWSRLAQARQANKDIGEK